MSTWHGAGQDFLMSSNWNQVHRFSICLIAIEFSINSFGAITKLSSKAKLGCQPYQKWTVWSNQVARTGLNISQIAKTLHKRLHGHKSYPKSYGNNQKLVNPCLRIAHTKISKLLDGTSTLKTLGQDTMIIPPLSQRTVRGSTMSGRPLTSSTKTKYNKEESLVQD